MSQRNDFLHLKSSSFLEPEKPPFLAPEEPAPSAGSGEAPGTQTGTSWFETRPLPEKGSSFGLVPDSDILDEQTRLNEAKVTCPNPACGEKYPPGALLCPTCGLSKENVESPEVQKSRAEMEREIFGTELVWTVKVGPSGSRGSARASHYRIEGKIMQALAAQARDARKRALKTGFLSCADRYERDPTLRESNAKTRPKMSEEHPLLGWDNTTPVDPSLPKHFHETRGFHFEAVTEAGFLDELAVQAEQQNKRLDPKTGLMVSSKPRDEEIVQNICPRQGLFNSWYLERQRLAHQGLRHLIQTLPK